MGILLQIWNCNWILLKQNNIYCNLVIQGLQIMRESEKTAKIIVKLRNKYNKPIIVSFVGGDSFKKAISIVEKIEYLI